MTYDVTATVESRHGRPTVVAHVVCNVTVPAPRAVRFIPTRDPPDHAPVDGVGLAVRQRQQFPSAVGQSGLP